MDRFTEVSFLRGGVDAPDSDELVLCLAKASPSELGSAARALGQTEEMSGWSPSDGLEVLTDVQRVARRLRITAALFLYTSL